ncbi:hypothetical protein MCOR25_009274 [Pyricularia grisea]|nr:hypothetical protein MCOR25_009274 [Pyricularia grisea]
MPQVPDLQTQDQRNKAQSVETNKLTTVLSKRINDLPRAGLDIPTHDKDAFEDEADETVKGPKIAQMLETSGNTLAHCKRIVDRRNQVHDLVKQTTESLEERVQSAQQTALAMSDRPPLPKSRLEALLPVLQFILSHEEGRKTLKSLAPDLSAQLGVSTQDGQALIRAERVNELTELLQSRDDDLQVARAERDNALANADRIKAQREDWKTAYQDLVERHEERASLSLPEKQKPTEPRRNKAISI